jgi:hypothetical protein
MLATLVVTVNGHYYSISTGFEWVGAAVVSVELCVITFFVRRRMRRNRQRYLPDPPMPKSVSVPPLAK